MDETKLTNGTTSGEESSAAGVQAGNDADDAAPGEAATSSTATTSNTETTSDTAASSAQVIEVPSGKKKKEKNYAKACFALLTAILAILLITVLVSVAGIVTGFIAIKNGKIDPVKMVADSMFERYQANFSDPGIDDPSFYSEPGIDDPGYSEEETKEDDVTIAGEYVIRSTKKISGAYLSGDRSELTDKEKETLDMASEIVDQVIKEGMTDFEKEKAIYEWMIHNLVYDEGALVVIPTAQQDVDNPYGVLKYHNAVCVGYATTFRLFMEMLEIPCMVVHNPECYHSWDLIQLDGEWYHTDIYSDMNTDTYMNFNMNESLCARNHNWDTEFFPKANALKYNVAYMNSTELKDGKDLPAAIRKALDEGTAALGFKFKDMGDEEFQLATYIMEQINSRVEYTEEYGWTILEPCWSELPEGGFFLALGLTVNKGEEEFSDIDEKTRKEVEQKLDEVFQDLTPSDAPEYYGDYSDSVYQGAYAIAE